VSERLTDAELDLLDDEVRFDRAGMQDWCRLIIQARLANALAAEVERLKRTVREREAELTQVLEGNRWSGEEIKRLEREAAGLRALLDKTYAWVRELETTAEAFDAKARDINEAREFFERGYDELRAKAALADECYERLTANTRNNSSEQAWIDRYTALRGAR